METKNICICGQYGRYMCSRCKSKYYCSTICQKKDWDVHKKDCVNQVEIIDLENRRNKMFSNNEKELLMRDFSQLNNNDRNKYLDIQMELFRGDLLDQQSLVILFERLDLTERYSDMMRLAISYPKIICDHYDATFDYFCYNISHKWNGDLINLVSGTLSQSAGWPTLCDRAKEQVDPPLQRTG